MWDIPPTSKSSLRRVQGVNSSSGLFQRPVGPAHCPHTRSDSLCALGLPDPQLPLSSYGMVAVTYQPSPAASLLFLSGPCLGEPQCLQVSVAGSPAASAAWRPELGPRRLLWSRSPPSFCGFASPATQFMCLCICAGSQLGPAAHSAKAKDCRVGS